jgi:hypothetical protein
MNLKQRATISPPSKKERFPGTEINRSEELSLFEAVRRWMDDEGNPFDIKVDGSQLTAEKIHEIALSEPYKELLLAFDERR